MIYPVTLLQTSRAMRASTMYIYRGLTVFWICFEILALQERQWEPGAQSTSGSSGEAMLPENKRVAPE